MKVKLFITVSESNHRIYDLQYMKDKSYVQSNHAAWYLLSDGRAEDEAFVALESLAFFL